jgi:penicillin-binding protein 2
MFDFKRWKIFCRYIKKQKDLDPDEIFVDSSNLPNFDTYQFEGRLEKPISRRSIFILSLSFLLVIFVFVYQTSILQITKGEEYFNRSENNRLRNTLIFSKRGVIYDRLGVPLVWNTENPIDQAFDLRKYIDLSGFAHTLGYVKYPGKDKQGFYFTEVLGGISGVEKYYNEILSGKNGKRIVEVDALGNIQSENIIHAPVDGENIYLSIDSGIQNKMYEEIEKLAKQVGFTGGAGIIMDIHTGEVLAMTSYPEYSSQVMTDGKDNNQISNYRNNNNNPFLNRLTDGLYAPGSIVKPFMAIAALAENTIDPYQNILSTAYLSIPNPYDPSKPTLFRDWKVHGYVDMRKALAVSSDVYFYTIGGGFENQKGLGIDNIYKYMHLFGLGSTLSSPFFSGVSGNVPSREWKEKLFPEDPDWRVGNTYHTSIGQYGFQISPVQALRAVSAIASGGTLVEPSILLGADKDAIKKGIKLDLKEEYFQVAREGMRDAVTKDYGTVKGLNSPNYNVAGKTGTAEIGAYKQFVNSWVIGFFPYENPKYVFTVIMERGSVTNLIGATSVMRQVLDFMWQNKKEYFTN